ncbi:alkyl sulfatase dimerization domain-containing protein [Variovorax sp. J22R133]|uniref:alkyl/aryl-sulfatase n=1 Tax=Variovorax brevis TaxID=3053503 RepID=UPI002577BFFE|nr:alkyl sulfatase dimerization domain-containing protein [Variovorax sp. J22R133]MDM0117435.1 alkyl sulfatase dimerization domain-containing protein [Variovorax sp. J22R133]
MKHFKATAMALSLALAFGSIQAAPTDAAPAGPAKAASEATASRNAAVLKQLPFEDRADFEAAGRGLIAPFDGQIRNDAGQVVWDSHAYDFLQPDQAPATVNPSLWRHAQLNARAGLFKVTDRVYQLRGMDLANMTVIEGDRGLIIIDPLMSAETARAALALYRQHRPARPVVAVIYSHSHIDHFGGVRGVVDEADVKSGKVKIYAPSGFLEEAISENLLAGTAMFRRGMYQGGSVLPRGERAQIDAGLGKGTPRSGSITLIAPTKLITKEFESHVIDGVPIEFQLTPNTEAPSEMHMYLPRQHALCMAENATRVMHNLLTPRGAQVRDAKGWSRYLDDSLVRYGEKAEVMFTQHSWPTWGGENIRMLLADQRDMYAFMNDRTLHLANQGLTPNEISAAIQKLPGDLDRKWYTRGYYGVLSFNVRAVYQRYLGFYDANPANLDPLPPVDAGKRYVASMGGAAAVLAQMRDAMGRGDYRWAVQIGNHLVFAEPDNKEAREAQADALEQLGYQSESAVWRNIYLSGAADLRNGAPELASRPTEDLVKGATPAMFFDYLAVRLDSEKAQGNDMTLNWRFEDVKQSFALTLRNGVLTHRDGTQHVKADVAVRMSKSVLDRISLRQLDFATALKQGDVRVEGNAGKLTELLGMMDTFKPTFNIVTP